MQALIKHQQDEIDEWKQQNMEASSNPDQDADSFPNTPLLPIKPNLTRWNSVEAMLERGVKVRSSIDSIVLKEVVDWQVYWTKLDKYYALTDRSPAYIAATVVTAPSLMRFGSLGYTIFLAPWPILR
jgi:hypothetical protein